MYRSSVPITNKSDNIVVHNIFTCEGIHKSDHFHAYVFPRTLDDYKTHLMDTIYSIDHKLDAFVNYQLYKL